MLRLTIKRSILLLCVTALLMFSAGAGAEAVSLPMDYSGGIKLNQSCFTSPLSYEDPTISVQITQGRENDCDYWIADIRIANAAQLRTAGADDFESNMTMDGVKLATRVNAVLALDGDYFCYTEAGYIIRQGVPYINVLNGTRDALLIDEDGDLHVVLKPEKGSLTDTIDGKKVVNSFNFGPALVVDGKVRTNGYSNGMAADKGAQRMALCQVGPLHYKVICCASPFRGSVGMTMDQFAKFVASQPDVITAYNLDGGDSTMMIFGGTKINDPDNPNTRQIADLIYFASAWQEE